MKTYSTYFLWPSVFAAAGLAGAYVLGTHATGEEAGGVSFVIIGAVLAVLEVSLSFDNAIVNANRLKTMDPVWQGRFLTWGILIAVFGMRILFPLAVVAIAAGIGPGDALAVAVARPHLYGYLMHEARLPISAFGGFFLMMVALRYFIDREKNVDWFRWAEKQMRGWSGIHGIELAIGLAVVVLFRLLLPDEKADVFAFAAVCGMLVFLLVEFLGRLLDGLGSGALTGGIGAFLYLEVLDASFSFDGVIGAFALTHNLFLIAIGLGIGALFVRAMTMMLVERETLAEFRYLEHGAFYAILVLSVMMFAQTVTHVPEPVIGLIGAALILMALVHSVVERRRS